MWIFRQLLTLKRGPTACWRTKSGFLISLRLFWVVLVLWCELGVFFWSLSSCRWPDAVLKSDTSSSFTHILLIADPQILDQYSYPGRAQWLTSLSQYMVDLNLRKSWNAVISKFDPHMVIFLGDMMDNGRNNVNEDEYTRYYNRFRSIFQLDIPVYFLPGNHDVDLGYSFGRGSTARDRYREHFGATNQQMNFDNHTTFVLIDAPGLVDEDYHRHAAQVNFHEWRGSEGGTVNFLKNFTENLPAGPIVLFSHIPFFRPDRISCGPLREKGTIRPGMGRGYQNLLLRETSSYILESIRPSLIFSADDHDYCEYNHRLTDGSTVREVTVKSFSMAMGIRRPGFQLLSLARSNSASSLFALSASDTLADVPCFLPDQIKIYTHGYAPFGVFTSPSARKPNLEPCVHARRGAFAFAFSAFSKIERIVCCHREESS
ncbi:Metallo-dependent phosphatase [Ramaria rubella]|nr:Metallo-dependent phosphatase [Ramaria rubella]